MWGASCKVWSVQCQTGRNNTGLDVWKKLVDVLDRWNTGWWHSWKTLSLDVRTRQVWLIQLIRCSWWHQLTWTCKWLILPLQWWGWNYRGRRQWQYCTMNETAELIQNLLKFCLRNTSVCRLSHVWGVRGACRCGWGGSHLLQCGYVVLCAWIEWVSLICMLLLPEHKVKFAEDLGSCYLTAVRLNKFVNCVACFKETDKTYLVWKNGSSLQGTDDWLTTSKTVGRRGKGDVKRQRDGRNEYLA